MPTNPVVAHKMIADLALEMANEVFESMCAQSDKFYAAHRTKQQRRDFLNNCAPTLVQEARQTLATMLGRNDVSEDEKMRIYDALQMDRVLPDGARGGWQVPMIPTMH